MAFICMKNDGTFKHFYTSMEDELRPLITTITERRAGMNMEKRSALSSSQHTKSKKSINMLYFIS